MSRSHRETESDSSTSNSSTTDKIYRYTRSDRAKSFTTCQNSRFAVFIARLCPIFLTANELVSPSAEARPCECVREKGAVEQHVVSWDMLNAQRVFGVVVTRSQNFHQGGDSHTSPLPYRFDRVCRDVIKRCITRFLHQGVACNMSEGSKERLMDQDQNRDLDLKRSGRGDEEVGEIQAAKRRRAAGEEQKQDLDQKQKPDLDQDQDQDGENKKCPKKKVALLMAYSGKGYYGMQVQTETSSSASGVPVWECDRVVVCARGTLEAPSSGPLKTTWSAPSSSPAASLRTTART